MVHHVERHLVDFTEDDQIDEVLRESVALFEFHAAVSPYRLRAQHPKVVEEKLALRKVRRGLLDVELVGGRLLLFESVSSILVAIVDHRCELHFQSLHERKEVVA